MDEEHLQGALDGAGGHLGAEAVEERLAAGVELDARVEERLSQQGKVLDGNFELQADGKIREEVEVGDPAVATHNRFSQARHAGEALDARESVEVEKIGAGEDDGHGDPFVSFRVTPGSGGCVGMRIYAMLSLVSEAIPGALGVKMAMHSTLLACRMEVPLPGPS